MARRPRQRQEREVKTIEIKRNVIERFLMDAKGFIKKNNKFALYSLIRLLGAAVILVGVLVAMDRINAANQQRFDELMDRLGGIKGPTEKAAMDTMITDLKKYRDSTYFGFSHNATYYVLGNIYYDRRDWKEARQNLTTFADKEKKNVLAPLALLKAALALEQANDLKGAIELYRKMEDRYGDSALADQIFYNYARACGLNGDLVNSRMYYNRVISSYPDSQYAQEAKKRLFLLGALEARPAGAVR
jgi:tetratricopeptide (TPR) repeat protein